MLLCLLFSITWIVKGPVNVDLTWVSRAGHIMALGHHEGTLTSMQQHLTTLNISGELNGSRSDKAPLLNAGMDSPWIGRLTNLLGLVLTALFLLTISVLVKGSLTNVPSEQPKLYYMKSSLNTYVVNKCKLTDRVFCSSKLFSNRHFQTLLPYILPKPEVTFEREYLQMHDKGVVALDWVTSCQERVKRRAPILLVIPPVTEGAAYVSNICFSGTERGFRVVVFNRRGEGGSYLTTPKLQSFCDPSDLTQAIEYVTLKVVGCPLAAVAYGTGCGMLMSYIGTSGSSSKLVARVCISPSYEAPSKSNCPIYDTILLLKLKCLVLRHMKALSSVLDISKVMSTWMLPEFSSSLYCPLYGCPSPSQLADAVKPVLGANSADVPLLCINGLDDPVCASAFLPYHTFQSRTNSLLVVTNKGGHCGFYHQLPPKSWSDSLSLDYILAVEEFNSRASRLPKQARIPFRATSAPGCLNMYCSTGDLRDRKVRSKESNLNTIHEKENVMESFPPKVYFE